MTLKLYVVYFPFADLGAWPVYSFLPIMDKPTVV
jgi:hypothetical protein